MKVWMREEKSTKYKKEIHQGNNASKKDRQCTLSRKSNRTHESQGQTDKQPETEKLIEYPYYLGNFFKYC